MSAESLWNLVLIRNQFGNHQTAMLKNTVPLIQFHHFWSSSLLTIVLHHCIFCRVFGCLSKTFQALHATNNVKQLNCLKCLLHNFLVICISYIEGRKLFSALHNFRPTQHIASRWQWDPTSLCIISERSWFFQYCPIHGVLRPIWDLPKSQD